MGNPIKKLGLNLGGDSIYLSELQLEKNKFTLTGLYPLNIEPITSLSQIVDDNFKKELKSILSDTLIENDIKTTDIGISIDYKMGLLKKINYDTKLNDKELSEHFYWELAQYIDDVPENFIFDIDKIETSGKRPAIVLGAASKIITEFINEVLPSSLDLRLIDFNILSASNTVEVNYELSDFELTALVKIGADKIITLFNTGYKFKGLITKLYRSADPTDYEKLASDTLQLIQKGFKKYNTNKDKKGIDRIFLYQGFESQKLDDIVQNLNDDEFVNLKLSESLDDSKKQKIEIVNPFKKIDVSLIVREKTADDSILSVYSESIGSAAKLINKNL